MTMGGDTGVRTLSECLLGKNIVLVISGGIAATESIKLARELRRHGARVYSVMTKSAEQVITPLAVSWGSGFDVLTDWDPKMSQLGGFDGLLLAPATRNTIAKFVHGIIDSPAMMALSAASGNNTPMMFVPSMHDDLFDDRVTSELLDSVTEMGVNAFVSDSKEGRRKQPDPVSIVGNFCHLLNCSLPGRKSVAVTLGGNRAPIDSIRYVQNTSSGKTGWSISEYLHRMGHTVVCIAGHTTTEPVFDLPDVRYDPTPDGMLELSMELALSEQKPDSWIHVAAVLDYVPEFSEGKHPSEDQNWQVNLSPSKKHIAELSTHVAGSKRIGFKLEVESGEYLIGRAMDLLVENDLDAVVANLLIESSEEGEMRCRIVFPNGKTTEIEDLAELCRSLEELISTY
ncbi:MAG: hypothetical protein CMA88_03365 [Euryarchaeota archaeon]|nr:hypothetical protein [Euryarchaeota archaeon]